MRLWGYEFTVRKAARTLQAVEDSRGWITVYSDQWPGAWQQHVEIDHGTVLTHHAVFACITLIASDIAKLRVKLVERGTDRIWTETENPAYSPVLRKPNGFQTRIQFWESYMLSKLSRGNTYALKIRDDSNKVRQLIVLDPCRCKPLVSEDGQVFYELHDDRLADLQKTVVVPASEIIHDRFNCLFHPLVGISPIFASGLSATQGLNIQMNAARFFGNAALPSGILIAPGAISTDTATRLKETWENNYGGEKAGRVAVLGDGLKFERMTMTSVESQMIEQLKYSAEVVCSTYHVPPYKIGLGALPSYNNVQALNVEYYSQGLQSLIEAAELCLDEGLGLGDKLGTEFDIDGLLRMDSVTQMDVADKGVKAGVLSPDEARARIDLKPVAGGGTPYLQQQNYSLAALAKRDAQENPFASPAAVPPPTNDKDDEAVEDMAGEGARSLRAHLPAPLTTLLLEGPRHEAI